MATPFISSQSSADSDDDDDDDVDDDDDDDADDDDGDDDDDDSDNEDMAAPMTLFTGGLMISVAMQTPVQNFGFSAELLTSCTPLDG